MLQSKMDQSSEKEHSKNKLNKQEFLLFPYVY